MVMARVRTRKANTESTRAVPDQPDLGFGARYGESSSFLTYAEFNHSILAHLPSRYPRDLPNNS